MGAIQMKKKETKKTTVLISLTEEQREKLKYLAKKRGMYVSDLVSEMIENYDVIYEKYEELKNIIIAKLNIKKGDVEL